MTEAAIKAELDRIGGQESQRHRKIVWLLQRYFVDGIEFAARARGDNELRLLARSVLLDLERDYDA